MFKASLGILIISLLFQESKIEHCKISSIANNHVSIDCKSERIGVSVEEFPIEWKTVLASPDAVEGLIEPKVGDIVRIKFEGKKIIPLVDCNTYRNQQLKERGKGKTGNEFSLIVEMPNDCYEEDK